MQFLVIRLDPERLANPDADLRYQLPARIEQASGGLVRQDAFDYGPETNHMFLFLRCDQPELGLAYVIEQLQPLDLQSPVAIQRNLEDEQFEIVYPPELAGQFLTVQ